MPAALGRAYLYATLWMGCCVLAGGCGNDSLTDPPPQTDDPETPAPTGGPDVTVAIQSDTASPGDTVLIGVTVLARNIPVREVALISSGVVSGRLDLDLYGTGTWNITVAMPIPTGIRSGTLIFRCAATNVNATTTAADTMTVFDTRPPIGRLNVPTAIELGHDVGVEIDARDNGLLSHSMLNVWGAASYSDSIVLYDPKESVSRSVVIPLSDSVVLGDSIFSQLEVWDSNGNADTTDVYVIRVADLTRPAVVLSMHPTGHDPSLRGLLQYVTGDTIRFEVTAWDDRRLKWFGYQMCFGYHSDSVQMNVDSASAVFEVVTQPGWNSRWCGIAPFATDSVGNRTVSSSGANVDVFDGRRRTYTTVENNYTGGVQDVVYDSERDLLYLSQPDSQRVAVLSLSSLAFEPSIELPARPCAIDLTVGGDSLLIAMSDYPHLGVANLAGGYPSVDTLVLSSLAGSRAKPVDMAIVADDKVIVALSAPVGTYGDSAGIILDLSTGTEAVVPFMPSHSVLERSGNRSVALAKAGYNAVLYRSEDGAFGSPFWHDIGLGVIDPTGTYFMVWSTLYYLDQTWVIDLLHGDRIGAAAASPFTADGRSVFLRNSDEQAYRKYSVPDGALLDRVLLPLYAGGFLVLDEERLAVFVGDGAPAFIVDIR